MPRVKCRLEQKDTSEFSDWMVTPDECEVECRSQETAIGSQAESADINDNSDGGMIGDMAGSDYEKRKFLSIVVLVLREHQRTHPL